MNSKSIYLGVFSNISGNVLMLGATIWLTRILSPAEFGEFRVGANFATMMVPFLSLGGERLISRLIQNNPNHAPEVSRALGATLMLVMLGFFILTVVYPLLSKVLFDEKLGAAVYFLSILIIPMAIAYNLANTIWRHVGSPAAAQIDLNLSQRLLRAPLLIVTGLLWPTAFSASLAMAAAQALSLARIHRNLTRYLSWPRNWISSLRENFGTLASIGLPVAVIASIDRLDVLLVNYVMGVERAGAYDLVYMLALTAMFPAMAMSKTAEPLLFALAQDSARQKRVASLQTRTFLLSVAAIAGVFIVAPIAAHYLTNVGPGFAQAAIVMSAGLAFSSCYGPVLEYLQINGKTRMVILTVLALLLLFIFLKYLAAVTGSIVGVATLAGMFYFVLRSVLSFYIYLTDRVLMGRPWLIIVSLIGYVAVVLYAGDWK
ncbi:lipopolysaccharide biosynthesis protein [Variovorax paradoxus]|uniref:Polysaccharide biosynthesis protein n=1 Tax=Variovorax paradoxus TaxID=34073 RepID=A0A0H2M205_VARPD|nr:oligosaccharide flippase family protein [Variovorax paradoxus]KLN56433.1 polysaccharide biosynthesis protein [Variovorax paradoxus]